MIDVLDELARVAEQAAAAGDADRLLSALDGLTTITATAIKYGEMGWIDEVTARLQAVYEVGFRGSVGIHGSAPRLWFDVIARVMAIGALAVATGRDDVVPDLVLRSPAGMDRRIYTNWITHAAIQAARAGFLAANSDRGEITFLRAVEVELGSLEAIGSAFKSFDKLPSWLAQFDVLAAITVWDKAKGIHEYPYLATFAGYYQDRYEPAIIRIIQNPALRRAVFGGTDEELRRVLRILEAQGRKHLASYGGGGAKYVAPEIHQFLSGQ